MARPANTYRAQRREAAKQIRKPGSFDRKHYGYRRTVGQCMRPVPNVWPRKGA